MHNQESTLPDVAPHHIEHIRVRYSDTDAQGIVHHSNYFRWIEEARIGFLTSIASSYKQMNARGLFIPVVSCTGTFRSPAVAADLLDIRLWVRTSTRARLDFTYQVRRSDALLATASSTHAFVNEEGNPVRLNRDDPFWILMQNRAISI